MATEYQTVVIRSVSKGFGGEMVHVGDPQAYEAFSRGRMLFDIAPGAEGLHAFMKQNEPEFGGDFKLSPDGSFRSLIAYNRTIYVLSRKHASPELTYNRGETWR